MPLKKGKPPQQVVMKKRHDDGCQPSEKEGMVQEEKTYLAKNYLDGT